jgi:hypothetical protein
MEGLDLSQRPAAFLRVREGLGLLERLVAGADGLGEPVLIEFGRLRFPPAGGDIFRGDGDGLEARFREGERRGGCAQGLGADLLQGVREEPALELDPVFGGAFARLEFVQGGFGAVGEGFVVDDRGVEGRDEFEEVGLAFEEVGEKIGIVRGKGAERSSSVCLASSFWLSAMRGSRFMNTSCRREPGAAKARRDATNMEIAAARFLAGCWKFKVGRLKFTDGCACRRFC